MSHLILAGNTFTNFFWLRALGGYHLIQVKWTAFKLQPVKALFNIAKHSPIHALINTDDGVNHARRQPARQEQLGLCVLLRDITTLS